MQKQLTDRGHSVEAIHSDLSPVDRTRIMKEFRSGNYRVLISTDLLSRGIDIQQIGYVINYELPFDLDSYLHRIGRSGRFGKKGIAINFITRKDGNKLNNICKRFHVTIEEMPQLEVLNNYLAGK